jgi:hypothetical protein
MPSAVITQSVAAGAAVNFMQGQQYEILPFNAFVEIAIQTSAVGVLATVYSGTDILQEESPVQIGTVNVLPKYPDDFYLSDEALALDRIKVQIRNTTGGALTVVAVVRIRPL